MPGRLQGMGVMLQTFGRLKGRRWQAPVFSAVGMVVLTAALLLIIAGGVKYPPEQTQAGEQAPQVVKQEGTATIAAFQAGNDGETRGALAGGPDSGRYDKPHRPLNGKVRLDFGWQEHPVYNDWRYHTGVDIGGAPGSPVYAVYSGEVAAVYEDRQFGLTIVVRSGEYTVCYGSLAAAAAAKGDQVTAGGKIGSAGSSESEPYPHLHLSVKKVDKYINPLELLRKAE